MKHVVRIYAQTVLLDTDNLETAQLRLSNLKYRAAQQQNFKPGEELFDTDGDPCIFVGPAPGGLKAVVYFPNALSEPHRYGTVEWDEIGRFEEKVS